jgi:hypothetical protein
MIYTFYIGIGIALLDVLLTVYSMGTVYETLLKLPI